MRTFAGNTADPAAFVEITKVVGQTFRPDQLVMVGDLGMITKARTDALVADDDCGLGWITVLRAPAINKPAADDGPLQLTCSTRPTWPRSPTRRQSWLSQARDRKP